MTKQRIVEYSADESEDDDDEDSGWEIERSEPNIGAANEGKDVPSVRENSPRPVGGKRNKNQCETATRKSTRQRRGVDKMGGGGYVPPNRTQMRKLTRKKRRKINLKRGLADEKTQRKLKLN